MKLIHMSDLHLTEKGKIIWGTDTMAHFDRAIDDIRHMDDIDAIIVTGDLSDDGSLWSYQYADKRFASIEIPTYCCPGNHDSLKTMLCDFRPAFISFLPTFCLEGWKIILANTVVPDEANQSLNKSRGFLSDDWLLRIEEELKEGLPTIIAMHHPSQEPGGWLNRRLLENRSVFNDMITNYPNARLVLYGHTHYFTDFICGNIRHTSSSAIGYAFNKDLPKFQIAEGLEGYNIIEIKNETITITPTLLS